MIPWVLLKLPIKIIEHQNSSFFLQILRVFKKSPKNCYVNFTYNIIEKIGI